MIRVRWRPLSMARVLVIVSTILMIWSFIAYRSLRHRYPGFLNALSQKASSIRLKEVKKEPPVFDPVNRSPKHLRESALKFARKHKMARSIQKLYTDKNPLTEIKNKRLRAAANHRTVIRVRRTKHGVASSVPVKMRSKRWDPCLLLPLTKGAYWPSSPFGPRRRANGRWGFHRGIDMAASRGTPIKSAGAGVVIEAGFVRGYGNTVVVDHGHGMKTRYAHMSAIKTRKGKHVKAGEIIGKVGATGYVRKRPGGDGSHLHFEVEVNGTRMNPSYFLIDAY